MSGFPFFFFHETRLCVMIGFLVFYYRRRGKGHATISEHLRFGLEIPPIQVCFFHIDMMG